MRHSQQGIPVLTMDSDAPDSKRLFFVGTDNYNAGTMGGKSGLETSGRQGQRGDLDDPEPAQSERPPARLPRRDRRTAGLKITQVVDMKGDPTVAFDTAKQMLEGKTKVDAFVCLEAISCPEVGEVVNRQNMGGKVKVIAMDTDQRTSTGFRRA